MNNEGNVSVNQNDNVEQPVLKPMEGVRIAPVSEAPVNASNSATATSSVGTVRNTPVAPAASTATTNVQAPPTVPEQPATNLPPQTPPPAAVGDNTPQEQPKQKKKGKFTVLLLIIIIGLLGYFYYYSENVKVELSRLNYECTPITASKNEKELNLDSTIVSSLYSKVQTTMREDLAQTDFDDTMRIYLAYRQIPETEKYESNCNLFSKTDMEPFTCEVSTSFIPLAFKEDVMKRELKELFGEKTNIPLKNVRLGSSNTCVGGYQYIPERGEYVQGYCKEANASLYKKDAKLIKATSTGNTIVLKEEVKYHEGEKLELPERLKSGYYYYTFRLDMNYNYVLINKTYESKH